MIKVYTKLCLMLISHVLINVAGFEKQTGITFEKIPKIEIISNSALKPAIQKFIRKKIRGIKPKGILLFEYEKVHFRAKTQ